MKYLIFSAVLVSAFSGCRNEKESSNTSGTFDQRIDSLFATAPDFSGVALIAHDGKAKYHKAWGHKNFVTREPLDTNSVFELASLSKQFTAMTIMLLQEEGKLSYDDTVERYIPGIPYPRITIRHLLNHTSGLPDYQAIMDQYWDKSRVAGNTENIAYLIKYHPARHFAPGEKYEYSNTGYMLLATIAERASEKDFHMLSREMIFKPLDMNSTDIRSGEEKRNLPDMAWGHIYDQHKGSYIPADSFPDFN